MEESQAPGKPASEPEEQRPSRKGWDLNPGFKWLYYPLPPPNPHLPPPENNHLSPYSEEHIPKDMLVSWRDAIKRNHVSFSPWTLNIFSLMLRSSSQIGSYSVPAWPFFGERLCSSLQTLPVESESIYSCPLGLSSSPDIGFNWWLTGSLFRCTCTSSNVQNYLLPYSISTGTKEGRDFP